MCGARMRWLRSNLWQVSRTERIRRISHCAFRPLGNSAQIKWEALSSFALLIRLLAPLSTSKLLLAQPVVNRRSSPLSRRQSANEREPLTISAYSRTKRSPAAVALYLWHCHLVIRASPLRYGAHTWGSHPAQISNRFVPIVFSNVSEARTR
jgi:hypothetical protein